MFKVSTKRKFTFNHKDEKLGFDFSVTFDFPYIEDADFSSVRKRLEGTDLDADEVTENVYLEGMRKALIGWEGIGDADTGDAETADPLPLKDKEGNIIEINQKAVFEALMGIPALYKRITNASKGVTEKK